MWLQSHICCSLDGLGIFFSLFWWIVLVKVRVFGPSSLGLLKKPALRWVQPLPHFILELFCSSCSGVHLGSHDWEVPIYLIYVILVADKKCAGVGKSFGRLSSGRSYSAQGPAEWVCSGVALHFGRKCSITSNMLLCHWIMALIFLFFLLSFPLLNSYTLLWICLSSILPKHNARHCMILPRSLQL